MLAVRKALGILVSLIALAGVLVTGVLATRRIDQRPRTDDAYLQADLVHMAPPPCRNSGLCRRSCRTPRSPARRYLIWPRQEAQRLGPPAAAAPPGTVGCVSPQPCRSPPG